MAEQQVLVDQYYKFQPYDVKNVFTEFAKPIFDNAFFNNLATLRINADFINFNTERWQQRPTVFCLDLYEEPHLYPVIMLVNNVKSFLEFVPEYFSRVREPPYQSYVIIAPYRSEIKRVLNFVS